MAHMEAMLCSRHVRVRDTYTAIYTVFADQHACTGCLKYTRMYCSDMYVRVSSQEAEKVHRQPARHSGSPTANSPAAPSQRCMRPAAAARQEKKNRRRRDAYGSAGDERLSGQQSMQARRSAKTCDVRQWPATGRHNHSGEPGSPAAADNNYLHHDDLHDSTRRACRFQRRPGSR